MPAPLAFCLRFASPGDPGIPARVSHLRQRAPSSHAKPKTHPSSAAPPVSDLPHDSHCCRGAGTPSWSFLRHQLSELAHRIFNHPPIPPRCAPGGAKRSSVILYHCLALVFKLCCGPICSSAPSWRHVQAGYSICPSRQRLELAPDMGSSEDVYPKATTDVLSPGYPYLTSIPNVPAFSVI
jgi:hypothetical protein